MLKILNTTQVQRLDQTTIEQEGIASEQLMERAASKCIDWLVEHFDVEIPFVVFAGIGNNGGDALVIGRQLHKRGYSVRTYVIEFAKKHSTDFDLNAERLEAAGAELVTIESETQFPEIPSQAVVIDGIFGSGLSRPVEGEIAGIIHRINASNHAIVSIDIPSGLFADQSTPSSAIIHAHYTLTFQLPKLALMMPECAEFVGHWTLLDIGLSTRVMENEQTELVYTNDIAPFRSHFMRHKFDYKGTYGHALLVAGNKGTMGAAVMAARSALRSGLGLLTVQVDESNLDIIQSTVPEAMAAFDLEACQAEVEGSKYQAIGIGPGIGKSSQALSQLQWLLKCNQPMVIDADALNLIAENESLKSMIPEGSILTPHPKEFERLSGSSDNHFDRLDLLQSVAKEWKSFVVLKGAHSALATPEGKVYFNSTGNPGMATAGSGDVLTGIITGFLAQTNDPFVASLCGIYVHGLAGDFAANVQGQHSMLATDMISYIGPAMEYAFSI